MKITAIRFEPGTITPDLKRLDVVRSVDASMEEDAIGVWVGNVRIPWHRVQSAVYEYANGKPADLDAAILMRQLAEKRLADEGTTTVAVLPKEEVGTLTHSDGTTTPAMLPAPEAPPAAPKWAPRKRK